MKCDVCQRRLLHLEHPDRPPADVEVHLAVCLTCQEWQCRLIQLEANVPRLPIPPSAAGARLVDQILHRASTPARPQSAARKWGWRWVTSGAAAAAILIACGVFLGNAVWQAIQGPEEQQQQAAEPEDGPNSKERPTKGDSLVARLVRCDVRLARAGSPRERVEAVAELADQLQGESRSLSRAATTRELKKLALLYGKVVRQGVVPRSQALPAEERRKVLAPIVAQLARTELAAARLARETPTAAAPLRQIAAAAQEGEDRLRVLMGEEHG